MPSPEISVIIPAHNEEEYIEKTLKAIKNSSFKNYEIIVICDNCKDSTFKIAKKFTKKVYKVNFGIASKSRNFGVKKSKGKILIFNDADTQISKDYLKLIKKAVAQGIKYGTAKWVSETGNWFGKYWAWGNNRANKKRKIVAGNCFVERKAFEEIKGFNEKMFKGEDSDLGDRLKKKNKKFGFIEDVHYMPSERNFQRNRLKFWVRAILESWLYNLNKKRYIEKFSRD